MCTNHIYDKLYENVAKKPKNQKRGAFRIFADRIFNGKLSFTMGALKQVRYDHEKQYENWNVLFTVVSRPTEYQDMNI